MISMRQFTRQVARILLGCLIGLALAGTAGAGMVSTEDAANSRQALNARERIKVLAQRPELAKQLKAVGVAPDQAARRVDAMTDAEVIALADKLDSLPAGGAISNNELILVLILVILILVL